MDVANGWETTMTNRRVWKNLLKKGTGTATNDGSSTEAYIRKSIKVEQIYIYLDF